MVMNAILFYRILNSDFFAKSGSSSSGEGEHFVLKDGGGHPVSKDVNRIMKSFFEGEEVNEGGQSANEKSMASKMVD